MPERQSVLTARPRAFTISQAQSLIRHALHDQHEYYSITVNWRKSGTRRLRNVDDLDRLFSPNTVSTIATTILYADGSSFTLTLGYPNIKGEARPTEGTKADRTLGRVRLELDQLPLPTIKRRFFSASNLIAMAGFAAIFNLILFALRELTDWHLITAGVAAVLIGWGIAIPASIHIENKYFSFRTWLFHREVPEKKWTRGQKISVITLIATIAVPFLILAIS